MMRLRRSSRFKSMKMTSNNTSAAVPIGPSKGESTTRTTWNGLFSDFSITGTGSTAGARTSGVSNQEVVIGIR